MSKQILKQVFTLIPQSPAWSLQLLQYKYTNRDGLQYSARQIAIDPEDKLKAFLNEIAQYYGGSDRLETVDDYTGDFVNDGVYKLSGLAEEELKRLLNVTASPDTEIPLREFDAKALLFKGAIRLPDDMEDTAVYLITMQKPITFLSNKYLFREDKKKFQEIDSLILTLRKNVDVVILKNTIYLFGLAGEKLFHLDSTAKAICKEKVSELSGCAFLSDPESFSSFAQKGHNPRRFLAYNSSHFDALKDVGTRRRMSDKFGFPLEDGVIKTDDAKAVENLVKFLCNKGMIDPIDEEPVEVAGTKPWGK